MCRSSGTRCCGITAAAVALADAGIPMKDMLVSVAAGKINDIVVLDLDKAEDNYGQADLPGVGILPNSKEIAFLQMDGDLSPEEFELAVKYNMKAVDETYNLLKH